MSQAPKVSSNETIVSFVLPLEHICARFHKTAAHSRNQQDNKNWTRDGWGDRQGSPKARRCLCLIWAVCVQSHSTKNSLKIDHRPWVLSWWEGKLGEVRKETVNTSTSLQGRAMKRKISAFTYQFLSSLSWGGHHEKICWCDVLSDNGFSLFSKDYRLFSFSLQQWAPIRFWIS